MFENKEQIDKGFVLDTPVTDSVCFNYSSCFFAKHQSKESCNCPCCVRPVSYLENDSHWVVKEDNSFIPANHRLEKPMYHIRHIVLLHSLIITSLFFGGNI